VVAFGDQADEPDSGALGMLRRSPLVCALPCTARGAERVPEGSAVVAAGQLVSRLDELELLEREGSRLRPRDPGALLDALTADYRFDSPDVLACHVTGSGLGHAQDVASRLGAADIRYVFTGLPAAWLLDGFAQFRLVSVFVDDDPRTVADTLVARVEPRGANLQLIGPNDSGVFVGADTLRGSRVVSPVQAYLDLLALPERARDAAEPLRAERLNWRGDG
jgi:hypothetical protein